MIRFFIKMPRKFNSRKLWEKVEKYGINVMEIDHIWAYGTVGIPTLARVLCACLEECQELSLSTEGDDEGEKDQEEE